MDGEPKEVPATDLPSKEDSKPATVLNSRAYRGFVDEKLSLFDIPAGATLVDVPSVDALWDIVLDARIARPIEHGPVRTQNRPDTFLKDYLRRKGFFGKINSVSVTKLPFDESQFEDLVGSLSPERSFSFASQLELSSTGRGVIGILVTEHSAASVRGKTGTYDVYRNRILQGQDGANVIDRLKTTSAASFTDAKRDGLKRVISAGLPTLGKRR